MFALLFVVLAAAADRPFADERHLLDRRLETLRRILPDGPTPVGDAALVRDLATTAKLANVEALARPPAESGGAGHVPVDVSGSGRYADVERFFRQVALSHRLVDVESLTLTATPEDTVKLAAVLDLPYRPAKAPLPAPPDGTRARVAGVPRPQAEAFQRDQALALAKSEQIVALRRARRNPRAFLAELAAVARERPVTFGFASLGDDFVIRGLTVGQGPVRALEARLERGFFRLSDFVMQRRGACLQFEAHGRSPVVGPEAELPMTSEDPFEQDDSPCRVDRDPPRSVQVKSRDKLPGKGPLSIRLRDVDFVDVFKALHLLTSQAFLVDADVAGRVSGDLSGITLEDALAALVKAGGLKIADVGALHHVSTQRPPAAALAAPTPAAPGPGAPTVSFLLKRAEIRDVLAVMTDVDPSLAALGPSGSFGRVSLWMKDAPLDPVRATLLGAAGLKERWEENRRLLELKPGSEEPLVPVAATGGERRLVLRPQDLAVAEFELAGVVRLGDVSLALAYAPTGELNVYRKGDRLADGAVTSIDMTDVVLETEEGPLRLLVPPLR